MPKTTMTMPLPRVPLPSPTLPGLVPWTSPQMSKHTWQNVAGSTGTLKARCQWRCWLQLAKETLTARIDVECDMMMFDNDTFERV